MTSNAKKQLNSVLCILANIIQERCMKILSVSKKKTITVREIMCAIKLTFSGNLQTAILKECVESLTKYDNLNQTSNRRSKHTRIGMVFSPSVSEKFLRNFGLCKALISDNAPVCLSTALEYICFEILSSSIKYMPQKKSRLSIREIYLGIKNDTEMNTFFVNHGIYLIGEGVKQNFFSDSDEKNCRSLCVTDEIKKIQGVYDCLFISKSFFKKLVRYYVVKHTGATKLNKNMVTILQYVIENYIVHLLQESNRLSIYTGRKKVTGDDIKFILSLTEGEEITVTCGTFQQNDKIQEDDFSDISDVENC